MLVFAKVCICFTSNAVDASCCGVWNKTVLGSHLGCGGYSSGMPENPGTRWQCFYFGSVHFRPQNRDCILPVVFLSFRQVTLTRNVVVAVGPLFKATKSVVAVRFMWGRHFATCCYCFQWPSSASNHCCFRTPPIWRDVYRSAG